MVDYIANWQINKKNTMNKNNKIGYFRLQSRYYEDNTLKRYLCYNYYNEQGVYNTSIQWVKLDLYHIAVYTTFEINIYNVTTKVISDGIIHPILTMKAPHYNPYPSTRVRLMYNHNAENIPLLLLIYDIHGFTYNLLTGEIMNCIENLPDYLTGNKAYCITSLNHFVYFHRISEPDLLNSRPTKYDLYYININQRSKNILKPNATNLSNTLTAKGEYTLESLSQGQYCWSNTCYNPKTQLHILNAKHEYIAIIQLGFPKPVILTHDSILHNYVKFNNRIKFIEQKETNESNIMKIWGTGYTSTNAENNIAAHLILCIEKPVNADLDWKLHFYNIHSIILNDQMLSINPFHTINLGKYNKWNCDSLCIRLNGPVNLSYMQSTATFQP